jgi:flagellar assembly protein FliH
MDKFINIVDGEELSCDLSGSSDDEALLPDETKKEEGLAALRIEVYEEGFAEGEKAGIERGRNDVETQVERFIASIKEIALLKNKLYEGSEEELVDLILAAVSKIIRKELEVDRKIVAGVIKDALKNLAGKKDILIRVNSQDYFYILEHKERLFAEDGDLRDVRFEEDNSVGIGGCLIESGSGEVDARIEKQLERLEEAMRSARSRE